MIHALRDYSKKHEKDFICTGQTNISAMCSDVADRLEELYEKDLVKHGYWRHRSSLDGEKVKVTCSRCGYKVNYFWSAWQDARYCPHCGAKMDADIVYEKRCL